MVFLINVLCVQLYACRVYVFILWMQLHCKLSGTLKHSVPVWYVRTYYSLMVTEAFLLNKQRSNLFLKPSTTQ